MITPWMKPGGNRPPGDNPLFFSISGTGSLICPVAQARLDIYIAGPFNDGEKRRRGWGGAGVWSGGGGLEDTPSNNYRNTHRFVSCTSMGTHWEWKTLPFLCLSLCFRISESLTMYVCPCLSIRLSRVLLLFCYAFCSRLLFYSAILSLFSFYPPPIFHFTSLLSLVRSLISFTHSLSCSLALWSQISVYPRW